jgi:AraC family transcriptional regulator
MAELEVEIRDLAPQLTISVRFRAAADGIKAAFDEQMPRVGARIADLGAAMAGPPFARYHEMGPTGAEIELGAPLAERPAGLPDASGRPDGLIGTSWLPGGPAAVTLHAGSYDALPATYDRLARWIETHGNVPGRGPWEVYLTDPERVPDPADWRTEIVWPIG